MIAKIAVSAATYAIDKPYSYAIPPEMNLEPGMRVTVPFGSGNRRTEGVVLTVEQGSVQKLKWVDAALDEEAVLTPYMLRLAAFLRERYFCTFYDAIRAMLPGGLWFQNRQAYTMISQEWKDKTIRTPLAREILEHLESIGGFAKEEALSQLGSQPELEKALGYLVRKKWIQPQQDFRRRVSDKTEKIASLALSGEETMRYAKTRGRSAPGQRAVLELLAAIGSAPVKEICYFTGAGAATVRRLEELGLLTLTEEPRLRCREIKPAQVDTQAPLTAAQQQTLDGLSSQLKSKTPGVALLYGVTGSGKTMVYLHLIRKTLAMGKSAMLLVPEIALTPQLLGILAAWFGDTVAVLHSSLPTSERYDQWKRVRGGQAQVVVGTRSAVFAPCSNLGLVILDEEQEHTYKSQQNPRYDAKEVAIWRGSHEKALVLLGSATPSVESMYRAKTGAYRLYTLPGRFNGRPLPQVEIVDMKYELQLGNDTSFSAPLLHGIRQAKEEGKQTILFLNRRGNSRALVCISCQEAPQCPRCSARLTYHSANNRLMCHYCGYSQPVPTKCPRCGGSFKTIGTGTQKAQQELGQLAPDIRVLRMDTDTVTATNTHEMILDKFRQENIPVLLGTQMVAKGLDIPNVTLVGVLDGDLSLYSDGFRAGETTFNMLTQVVGRAGRGGSEGKAILQTMTPQHQVIQLAARQDYMGFYDLEIRLRQASHLPPFGDVGVVTLSGEEEGRVLRSARMFRDDLGPMLAPYGILILGPAPCAVPKINYQYRYRLTLRGNLDRTVRRVLAQALGQFLKDKNNRQVSAYIDINGFE